VTKTSVLIAFKIPWAIILDVIIYDFLGYKDRKTR
jgi:hypothetical protein